MKKSLALLLSTGLVLSSLTFASTVEAAVKKDRTPPSAPVFVTKGNINKASSAKYVLTGKGEPYSKLLVVATDGKTKVSKYATVDKKGTFSIDLNVASLRDGKITVTSTLTDESKNTSKLTTLYVTKDATPPDVAKVDAAVSVNKNNTAFHVKGTATKGAKLTVSLDNGKGYGVSKNVTTNGKGEFNVVLDMSKKSDGTYYLKVSQTDSFGNVSEYKRTVVKDTYTPGRVTIISADSIGDKNKVFVVNGKAEKNATVTVALDNGKGYGLIKDVKANEKGDFSVSLDMTNKADGTYYLKVKQKDAAGNTSDEFKKTIQKKTTPAIIPEPKVYYDKYINYDTVYEYGGYEVAGTVQPGAKLSVELINSVGKTVFKGIALSDSKGDFNEVIEFGTAVLPDGTYKLVVSQLDGNLKPVNRVEKTVIQDTVVPEYVDFDNFLPTIDNSNVKNFVVTGVDKTPVYEGNLVYGYIYDDSDNVVEAVAEVDINGKFKLTFDVSEMPNGPLYFMAMPEDKAGNLGFPEKEINLTKNVTLLK